jgi:hypothetical protein
MGVEPQPEKPKPPAPQITDDIKSDIIMRHKRGVKPFVIAELNDIPIKLSGWLYSKHHSILDKSLCILHIEFAV